MSTEVRAAMRDLLRSVELDIKVVQSRLHFAEQQATATRAELERLQKQQHGLAVAIDQLSKQR